MSRPVDYVFQGIELINNGHYAEAEQAILRGLHECEKQKDRFGIFFALGRLGFCYEKAGQIDKAKNTYEQAVSMGTDIPATYASLITILVNYKELDRAFQVADLWQQHEAFLPPARAVDIFINLAGRLIRSGEVETALDLLGELILLYPQAAYPEKYWDIRGMQGQAYEKANQLSKAMGLYADAIREGSSDRITYNRYLVNLEKQKQYDTELSIIEQGLKIQADASWEADLKKREVRIMEKVGKIPKQESKRVIPDFSIRRGEQTIKLIQQILFSPQLAQLANMEDTLFGAVSGKSPMVFAQCIGISERLWQEVIIGSPDGILVNDQCVVIYTRIGKVADGKTNVYFYSTQGNQISNYQLPGVPSQATTAGGQMYIGCRDGKLYAFSKDGKHLWSYLVPDTTTSNVDGSLRPCPYFIAASKYAVAFTSFGAAFVLSPSGKLQYKWAIPNQIISATEQGLTFTMSLSGRGATAIAVAPDGKQVWVGGADTLYQIADNKVVRKTRLESLRRINEIVYAGPDCVIVTGFDQVILVENGKPSSSILVKGTPLVKVNGLSGRIAIYSGAHLIITTKNLGVISEVDFAKPIHHCSLLDDGKVVIGTRYAILFQEDLTSSQSG